MTGIFRPFLPSMPCILALWHLQLFKLLTFFKTFCRLGDGFGSSFGDNLVTLAHTDVSEYLDILLYLDDPIICIECDPAEGVRIFILMWAKVQEFSTFSGLHTYLDKSNILLKG